MKQAILDIRGYLFLRCSVTTLTLNKGGSKQNIHNIFRTVAFKHFPIFVITFDNANVKEVSIK